MNVYDKFLMQFKHLHVNKKGAFVAPHKPVLLIAVMDYLADNPDTNLIPPSERLNELFLGNWHLSVPTNSPYKPALVTPFIHMAYEPFWHLKYKESFCIYEPITSLAKLRANCFGATLDDELFELLQDDNVRDSYRLHLLKQYKLVL